MLVAILSIRIIMSGGGTSFMMQNNDYGDGFQLTGISPAHDHIAQVLRWVGLMAGIGMAVFAVLAS
jgi:hypothetical protein